MLRHCDKFRFIAVSILALSSSSIFAQNSYVIIDRIEADLGSDLSSRESALLIEIPTGVEISQADVATKLQETERLLTASGKFTDVELKLGKSTRPQHFVLTADLKKSSDHYFGVGGEAVYSPYENNWACSCVDEEKVQARKLRLNAYTGTRNYENSGWALDLDVQGAVEATKYSTYADRDSFYYKMEQQSKYANTSVNATAIQQNLLDGHGYLGGIFSLGAGRFLAHNQYDAKDYGSNTQTIDSADHSYVNDQILASAGLVGGLRFKKMTLGARLARSRLRFTNIHNNEDSSRTIDGNQQDNTDTFFHYPMDDRPHYFTEFVTTLAYSEKARLNLVEYGLDTFLSFQRLYKTNGADFPNVYAHVEYTWKFTDDLAVTSLLDGLWRRSDLSYMDTSLQRIYQLGGRVDYINSSDAVYFGQYTLAGIRRSDIVWQGSADKSGNIIRNRAEVGVQYASPDFLYSFSFIYGAEPISEIVEMNRKQFDRLGVH